MIIKRKLPHGEELINPLGIGTASLYQAAEDEIKATFDLAIEKGINFFDLAAGGSSVFKPLGEAMKGRREQVFLQLHLGAVYDEAGEYGWSRNLTQIKETFAKEMSALQTDYVDFLFLHCIDEIEDYQDLKKKGIIDFALELRKQGVAHHLGFSSHTPNTAEFILQDGYFDIMMFSINPAYDYELGDDEFGIGTIKERKALFALAEKLGVAISVMKPFHGGKLLRSDTSPFQKELSAYQCLAYALDRPGVIAVVPGVRNRDDLVQLLGFIDCSEEAKDYAPALANIKKVADIASCVYCDHCLPCPAGLDIGLINKYYDLARIGDKLAASHYEKLRQHASDCLQCGHCDSRCPFKVKQTERMKEIAEYFQK